MSDVDARLQRALRGDPPPAVAALEESTRAELVELITDARRRQAGNLRQAFDDSLKHLPFPLRGVVKKVLR